MAGSFNQLYVHIVIVVKNRNCLIDKSWQHKINSYISGIITNNKHKSIIVNGHQNHIHILIGLNPAYALSDLIRDIKNNSTNYVNQEGYTRHKFSWQGGYGAFSCSHNHMKNAYNYILNQEEHHRKVSFREEFVGYLKEFNIPYEEKNLFENM